MRILVWNVNGLPPTARNAILRHKSMKAFFESYGADVVCFQEVKIPEEKLTEQFACVDGYESFWSFPKDRKGYSGVTTWVKLQFSPVSAEVDCLGLGDGDIDREGRLVVTDFGAFVLINLYAPNAGEAPLRPRLDFKLRFFEALQAKVESLTDAGRQVVLVGDFNIALEVRDVHPVFDHASLYGPEEVNALRRITSDCLDVWRHLHPDRTGVYTVWNERKSHREVNQGLRIDYALCSKGFLDKVVSCEILDSPRKWSDHAALMLELKDIVPKPGRIPCDLSSRKMKKFKKQTTIMSMFSKKRTAEAPNDANLGARKQRTSDLQACEGHKGECSEKSPEDQAAK